MVVITSRPVVFSLTEIINFSIIVIIFKGLIIVVISTGTNIRTIFINPKENYFFLKSPVECELCVYRQEKENSRG